MKNLSFDRIHSISIYLAGCASLVFVAAFPAGGNAQAGMRRPKLLPPQEMVQRPLENVRRGQRAAQQSEQQNTPIPSGRPFFTRLQILQTLNLTTEQQAKIRDLRESMGSRMQVLRETLEERRDALNQAMYADTVDDKAIEELSAAIRECQGQILHLETRIELAFRGILTPDQLQRLRELQAEEIHVRKLQRELSRSERALRERFRNPQKPDRQPPERP